MSGSDGNEARNLRTKAGFVVHGRVQGVGYRWWVRREADSLGLSGTVRNARDGTVRVMARGGSDAIERLERALRRGPPMATVDRVERIPYATSGLDRPGFEIVR